MTDAQRRHPRAGTGSGHGGRPIYVSPYYRSYYFGYGYGYPGYYPYYPYDYYYGGFYGYYPYQYGYRPYRDTGSVRLLVDPPDTRVYVDGYYAGVVDDYDGIFQRLHVPPGRHEIALKLDGYRSHKLKAYIPEDHTLKIRHDMVKGTGEDPEEVVGDPSIEQRREGRSRYGYRDMDRRDEADDADDPGPGPARADEGRREEIGRLVLDVRPGDASIYVDGEFRGTGRARVSLRLPAGRHRVEVVHPGFRTAEREVEVRPGETTDVNLELDRS